MKCKQIFALLLEEIREMLDSEAFLDEFRIPGHFSRKRKLTMKNVVSFMLFHSRRSLRRKLDLLRELLPSADIPRVSRQALSKARHGIRHTLFKKIFDTSVALYDGNIASRRRWLGKYHLFAIDGSDLETPGSESSFEVFGSQSDPKNPDLFWSMALASTVYDVLEDIIVDAQIDAQFTNERDLAAMHIARMSELGIMENSIVIYDRGYYSAEMFKLCVDSGCFCLMRLHNNMKICRLDGDDVTTTVKAPDGTEIECRVSVR